MRTANRSARAHGLIELGCVVLVMAIVSIIGADVGVVCLANSTNDRACRDAARAAADGSDYNGALLLAKAALLSRQAQGGYIMAPPTLDLPSFQYEDFAGNPPPNQSPYVSVTTTMQVQVPAPVVFAFADFNTPDGSFHLRKTYTFPIVKTKLYLN